MGYKSFFLPRKNPKKRKNVLPTSVALVLGWRANCDVKILLYDSDPMMPNAANIAKVTNYLVSYASKGTERYEVEKEQIRTLIKTATEITGCERDLISLSRQILNKFVGEKLISKQECMVQLLNLDLWDCSESFIRVSLSGYVRLTKNRCGQSNRYLTEYAQRSREVSFVYKNSVLFSRFEN